MATAIRADLADRVGAIAAGTLAAQHFIADLRSDRAVPANALARFREVQIEHGCDSAAVEAFLAEMAKRTIR